MIRFDFFNFYLLRNPTYSLDELDDVSIFSTDKLMYDKTFIERILFSSESLFQAIMRRDTAKKDRILLSLRKYFVRTCSRCTPFEKLSTYLIGRFDENSNNSVIISAPENVYSLNVNYLEKVISEIIKYDFYQKNVLYFVNPTLIRMGSKYTFVRYDISLENKYNLMEFNYNDLINRLIKKVKNGIKYSDIINILKEDSSNIPFNEIMTFLISSKIVLSEFECCTITDNLGEKLYRLIDQYKSAIKNNDIISSYMEFFRKYIFYKEGKFIDNFRIDDVHHISLDERRHLIKGGINNNMITSQINRALIIYSKICSIVSPIKFRLQLFKDEFYRKYGDNCFVPIIQVLNPICGIEYPQGRSIKKEHELLKDISLPLKKQEDGAKGFSFLEMLIALKMDKEKDEIVIYDKDVANIESRNIEFPSTIYLQTEIMKNSINEDVIYIKGIGGKTAIEPLLRYEKKDEQIASIINDINNYEVKTNYNYLIADIPFYTGGKIDNLLMHDRIRNYEVRLQCSSNILDTHTLPLSDVYVGVEYGKLKLKSRKLKKYIYPINSTVHNYDRSNNCYYKFLSDYFAEITNDTVLPLSKIFYCFDFIPRIRYENVIFFPACWGLGPKEINWLFEQRKSRSNDSFLRDVTTWRQERKIPKRVLYHNVDMIMPIDFSIVESIDILLSLVKKTKKVWLFEFLYDKFSSPVKDENNKQYTNELILFTKVLNNSK